jgi:twitching motility protein PilT
MDLDKLLSAAISKGASDIHLKAGIVPAVRLDGKLVPLSGYKKPLEGKVIEEMAHKMLTPLQKEKFKNEKEVDLSYGVPRVGRFRVNVFQQRGTVRIVFRSVSTKVPKLDQLNLPAVLKTISAAERGLVLITGATGSGKSTTVAGLIDHINHSQNRHIITIEDPIEYVIPDRKCLITQRELGTDTNSFSTALRSALRQDPDVIFIGEMRDMETIRIALLAAETGHLVLSTLHTADATESINRILATYPNQEQLQMRLQLAANLNSIVSQRLATTKDGKGRIPVVEVMINTGRIREMIVDPKRTMGINGAIEDGVATYQMQSFDQALMKLVSDKMITNDEAIRLSSFPENFKLRLKGVTSMDGGKWKGFDVRGTEASFTGKNQIEIEQLDDDYAKRKKHR